MYIIQITMVRGGRGEWSAGEKDKNQELGEKNEKGERKKEEHNIKIEEKALKMHLFGL